jgi:3-methyladenine DNA glycosylase AlkD
MLNEVRQALKAAADPTKAAFYPRFFKAGKGEYAEGDKFLGVTVPKQRQIAKQYRALSINDALKLLRGPWHEERLTALLILVNKFRSGSYNEQSKIYNSYLTNTRFVNNWDLVDSSAHYIVGPWLETKSEQEKMFVLESLALSDSLWERRIAMLATFHFINKGKADEALFIAEKLINDSHDLIQKAVGWMLREIGKKVDRELLKSFLAKHYKTMPRTALRYAIEHFDSDSRQKYLKGLA